MFDLDPTNLARLLGVLVPLLVALVTKKVASQGLKGVINLFLSAVAGSTAYLIAHDGGYNFEGFFNQTLDAFIASITAYYGLIKPTGLAGTVAEKTANFGLGSPPTMETDDKGAEEGYNPDDGDLGLDEHIDPEEVISIDPDGPVEPTDEEWARVEANHEEKA